MIDFIIDWLTLIFLAMLVVFDAVVYIFAKNKDK